MAERTISDLKRRIGSLEEKNKTLLLNEKKQTKNAHIFEVEIQKLIDELEQIKEEVKRKELTIKELHF